MSLSLDAFLKFLQTGGPLGVAALIIYAITQGWLLPGSVHRDYVPMDVYKDTMRDRDDWKEIALTGTRAAERAVDLAERRRRDASR